MSGPNSVANRIRLSRPRILSADQLERIHLTAVQVLTAHGIRVQHPPALASAARAGLKVEGDRIFPDGTRIAELVAAARLPAAVEPGPDSGDDGLLWLSVATYAQFIHDCDSDTIVALTTPRLVEATKLVDSLFGSRVLGGAPGAPADVAPDLQRLKQSVISVTCARKGRVHLQEEGSLRAYPYLLAMADAIGQACIDLTVYPVSPLTVSDESFLRLDAMKSRLKSAGVYNMLSVGATAPVRLGEALALAAAEAMGAAIAVAEHAKVPVHWGVRVCPFDPRSLSLTLGAPEELLYQMASDEVNAWYRGREVGPPAGMLHSQAKLPDAQAAAERSSAMTLAAACGARHFSGAGTLSLDEVFSAEQLLLDCELRDHVERFVRGADGDCDPVEGMAEIAAGLDGGYLGLESTARLYRSLSWWPRMFERRALSGWQAAGQGKLRDRLADAVRQQFQQYSYESPPDVRAALDRVYRRAERDLA